MYRKKKGEKKMKIVKENVKMVLTGEEVVTLQDACMLLDKIANTIEHDNFQWLLFSESGEEINTTELHEMADKIESLAASPIELF